MKKNSCIINDVDISSLGMFILQGGDYDIFSFPQRIEPVQNNWYEQDGIDVDLGSMCFKEKKVTLSFYLSADNTDIFRLRLERFFQLIHTNYDQDNRYTKIELPSINRSFWLRYISCPEYNHSGGLYKSGRKSAEIKVEFSMDEPLQFFSEKDILIPTISDRTKTHVSLNGYDLSLFGIIVSECYNTMMRLPDFKLPLSRSSVICSGLKAFPSVNPKFENKQITISCTLIADSTEQFMHNYQALFNNINRPGAIYIETYYDDFECYYSDMQNLIKEEFSSLRIKISFDLIFTIVKPGRSIPVLVTQDIIPVTTENGLNYIRSSSALKQ